MESRFPIPGTKIVFVEANHQYVEIPVTQLDAGSSDLSGAADLTGYTGTFSYSINGQKKTKLCTIEGDTLLTSFEASETLGLGGTSGKYEARVFHDGKPYTVVIGELAIVSAVNPLLEPPAEPV